MQNSPFELIRHGGFMMVPLLISAFVALTLIFERLYHFKKLYSISSTQMADLQGRIQTGVSHAGTLPSEIERTPVGSIFKAGMNSIHLDAPELEKALSRQAQKWLPQLEKRLEVLDTIITAAPLMGLLGTITGMMASFQVLSTNGVNEPNAITGGVAEALIATATGLMVALVCLIFYNYFNSKVRETIEQMESMANLLLDQKSKS